MKKANEAITKKAERVLLAFIESYEKLVEVLAANGTLSEEDTVKVLTPIVKAVSKNAKEE
jgi:hypothetical protein